MQYSSVFVPRMLTYAVFVPRMRMYAAASLKAAYTSSVRPHTLAAYGLMHK
jgi:hypothetical protein